MMENPLRKQSEKACMAFKREVLEHATLRYIEIFPFCGQPLSCSHLVKKSTFDCFKTYWQSLSNLVHAKCCPRIAATKYVFFPFKAAVLLWPCLQPLLLQKHSDFRIKCFFIA